MGYRQLTQEQRYQISALLVAGKSQRQIAEMLGCHSSTICRELRRNGITGDYQANQAQQRSDQRRRLAAKAHKRVSSLIDWVSRLIRKRWSPEQIAGLMARMGDHRRADGQHDHTRADPHSGRRSHPDTGQWQ